MKIIIPSIEHAKKEEREEFKKIIIKSLINIQNKTGYLGWIEDDDGNLITGVI